LSRGCKTAKLGDLYVQVSSKGITEVNQDLTKVEQKATIATQATNLFNKALAGIGTYAIIRGFRNIINEFTNYCSEIDKARKITGISTDTLQKLRYAADQEGVSFETLNGGLRVLIRNMQNAKEGMADSERAFNNIGISALNADGSLRNVEDVFFDVMKAARNAKNETEASAIALNLLGRSGSELVPFLQMPREELERLFARLEDLNALLDPETIAAGKKFEDQLKDLNIAIRGVKFSLAEELLPTLKELATITTEFITHYKDIKKFFDIFKDFSAMQMMMPINQIKMLSETLKRFGLTKPESINQVMGGIGAAGRAAASLNILIGSKQKNIIVTDQMRQQYRDMIILAQALEERQALLTETTRGLTDAEIELAKAEIARREAERVAAEEEKLRNLERQAYVIQGLISPAIFNMYGALFEGGNAWKAFADAAVDAIKRIIVQMMALATIAAILNFIPGFGAAKGGFGGIFKWLMGFQTPRGDWWAQKEGRDFGKFFMDGFQTSFVPMLAGINRQQQPMNVVVHTGDPSTYVEFVRKLPLQYKSKIYRDSIIPAKILEG
jgi:hypothetical protein